MEFDESRLKCYIYKSESEALCYSNNMNDENLYTQNLNQLSNEDQY